MIQEEVKLSVNGKKQPNLHLSKIIDEQIKTVQGS